MTKRPTYGRTRALVLAMVSASTTLLVGSGAWIAQAEESAVTEQNVSRRIVTAKTAQDYVALAAYFHGQAADKAEQVKRHEAMLKSYDNVAGTSKEIMRNHCQMLIRSYNGQQKEYDDWAQQYDRLAKESGGIPEAR